MFAKHILRQKPVIIVENVVASSSLRQTIQLEKIVKHFKAKYNPDKFPGAVIRLDKPRSVVLIFKNGSTVCTGTRSEEMARKAIERFVYLLSKIQPLPNTRMDDIKIENMVASSNIGTRVHLEQAARILPRSMYEPEQFPAVIQRLLHPKTVVLIFASGKIVCAGAKSTEDLNSSVNSVYLDLLEKKLLV